MRYKFVPYFYSVVGVGCFVRTILLPIFGVFIFSFTRLPVCFLSHVDSGALHTCRRLRLLVIHFVLPFCRTRLFLPEGVSDEGEEQAEEGSDTRCHQLDCISNARGQAFDSAEWLCHGYLPVIGICSFVQVACVRTGVTQRLFSHTSG